MRLNRTKNAKKNIVWGLCNKILFMVFPFALRAMIIQTVGAEYLGIDSLFISILQVLSLAELGFGEAIVYSMYRPIANDDKALIGKILGFYRKVYRRIGIAILVIGLMLMPFLKYLVHGSYPNEINIYTLYFIYLFNTVISYWLFAYKQSIFNAYMQQYVIANVNMLVRLVVYILQLIVLWFLNNFYLYVLMIVINTVISNLILNHYVEKLHPDILCTEHLNCEIKADIFEKIKGLIIGKVTGVFRNAMDSVFVSAFVGLIATGVYANYFMILAGVQSFFMLLYESYASGAGNSIVLDSKEKNYRDLCYLSFFYMWLAGWVTICLCCLYQPFIKIVFGENMLFSDSVMLLFCAYFYVLRIGDILSLYSRGNGLWWKERYRSIGETLSNLLLTYILGYMYGVAGILVATIISLLLCGAIWGALITFLNYFQSGLKKYACMHIKYFAWTILVVWVMYRMCNQISSTLWGEFFLRLVICLFIPNILYWMRYRHTQIYKDSMSWLLKRIQIPRILRKMLLSE